MISACSRGEFTGKGGVIAKAFLPGAGLGTRLRPLTGRLPKPLVPVFHRPLIAWVMDACAKAGISEFAVNTHHLPEMWTDPDWGLGCKKWSQSALWGANGVVAREGHWQGLPVRLFHEPELLNTGGPLRNIAEWIGQDDILVFNGDIFSSLPIQALMEAHQASGLTATLALRTHGPAPHIAIEEGRVTDIRKLLGRAEGTHLFTGVYCFSPNMLELLPPQRDCSIIPVFLELARRGQLGGLVLDEGEWYDIGTLESYLAIHRELRLAPPVAAGACIAADVMVSHSVIGPGAKIGPGAIVRDSVVWPKGEVRPGETVISAVRM